MASASQEQREQRDRLLQEAKEDQQTHCWSHMVERRRSCMQKLCPQDDDRQEEEEEVSDDTVRAKIVAYRTDRWSRTEDGVRALLKKMMRAQASVLSDPTVIRLMVFCGRAAFLYDYSSDGLVAASLKEGGNPIWACLAASFMLVPYMFMALVLRESMPRRFSQKTGVPLFWSKVLWCMLAVPACVLADIVLNFIYLTSEPRTPEVFHYMTLRGLLELLEGGLQLLLQGYIFCRLWNPWHLMPDVGGFSVDPRLLGSSIFFSMRSIQKAWGNINKYATWQAGGSKLRFIRHMTNLGEGLAPSNFYSELLARRSVTISGAWEGTSTTELRNLAKVASRSETLENLKIHDASWLTSVTPQFVVTDSLGTFLSAPRLSYFELRGEGAMPAWIVNQVRKSACHHAYLEHALCEGQEEPLRSQKRDRILSHALLCAAADGNQSTIFREQAMQATPSLLAEALVLAAEQDRLEIMRDILLHPFGLEAIGCRIPDSNGEMATPLCIASRAGTPRLVKLLLLARACVNEANEIGRTPLWIAAEWNNQKCVAELLAARADHGKAANNGWTPAHISAIQGSSECLARLLEARADINKAESSGGTPVFVAAQHNNSECLTQLVKARADVDKANSNGATPVHIAAQHNSGECLQLLLEAGADLDKAKNNGATPIFVAAQFNSTDALVKLLEAGADLGKARNSGATPLFISALANSAECLAKLVEARAEINKASNEGATPLFVAAQKNSSRCLAKLLEARGDMNRAMNNADEPVYKGATPVLVAAAFNSRECLARLLEARADPDKANDDGATPVCIASEKNHGECLTQLLKARVDVNTARKDGATPVFVAAESGHMDCLEKLIEARADIGKATGIASTPASLAAEKSHTECLTRLMEARANIEAASSSSAAGQPSA